MAAFAKRSDASIDDAIAGIQKIKISSSKMGKENAGDGHSATTIQECLKTAQKRLAQPGENVQQLASLCQSCLRLLEQQDSPKISTKVHTMAYTTIRLLISAKAYAPALEEALRLHQSLSKEVKAHKADVTTDSSGATSVSSELSTDTLNLAVGAILTLALCFGEGAVKDSKQLSYVLAAADSAHSWFRLLPAQESAKHSQTLFKSLYRGSAKLLDRKNWEGLENVCLTMVSGGDGGGGTSTIVPLALGAIAKLAAHVPEPYGVNLLTKVILNCPAITSSLSFLEENQKPNSSSKFSSSAGAAAALEILRAALGAANSLRKRLATLAMHGPLENIIDTLGGEEASLEAATALEIVASIIGVGNSNNAAGSGGGGGVGAPTAANTTTTTTAFSEYAHSAAVALACSARIKFACIHTGIAVPEDCWDRGFSQAGERVLGWQWPIDFSNLKRESCTNSKTSPKTATETKATSSAACSCSVLSIPELVWLSSSLYNVCIDLLTRGGSGSVVKASIVPLQFSLAASITVLSTASIPQRQNKKGIDDEEDSEDSDSAAAALCQGMKDVGKRASVLIETLAKAGKEARVLTITAANVLALVFTAVSPLAVPSIAASFSTLVNSLIFTTVKHQQQLFGSASTKRQGGRKTKTTTSTTVAAPATTTASSQSLTAAVQNHPTAQVSEEGLAMVARAELVAWAETLSNSADLPTTNASSGAEIAAAAAAQHLLEAVYPSDTAPVDHARTLLLVERLHLNSLVKENLKKKETSCVERAQRVLRPLVKQDDIDALILDALIATQGVLDEAHILVQESIEHQKVLQEEKLERIKQNPSEVHADDDDLISTSQEQGATSPSSSSSSSTSKSGDFSRKQAVKWSRIVVDNAQEAITKLSYVSQRLSAENSAVDYKEKEDGKALTTAARELATLVGIHGVVQQEQQAFEAVLLLEDGNTNGKFSSETGVGVLQQCVLPAFDACADGAALEAAATDLAVGATTNRREANIVMQRAALSMAASLAYAASGAVVQALYCAGEGHRLLGSLVQSDDGGLTSGTGVSAHPCSDGWWNMSVMYCRSLLLVGRLFNSAGMMEEGIVALKEGQRMAEAMGSSLLTAAFTSQLAQIYAISGQILSASAAIHSAKSLLEGDLSSNSNQEMESIVQQWILASVACAATRVHAVSGEYTQAMLCCHTALDAIEEFQTLESSRTGLRPHVDAVLAAVHLARIEVLKAEGREIEEIGTAAKEALAQIDVNACVAFGAAPRAGLLLTQAAAGFKMEKESSSPAGAARLWMPIKATTDQDALLMQHTQYLWKALICSCGAPHVHRVAAFKLAPLVASLGHMHLAALLLHIGAGSTLQLQHQLVLHARERNAQRRQRASASTLVGAGRQEAEIAEAAAAHALNILDADLDWELMKNTLAGNNITNFVSSRKSANQSTVRRGTGGSKRGNAYTKLASSASAAEDVHTALATLNTQAAQTLHKWLSALPQNTPVCTVGARDDQDCLVISRLSLATSTKSSSGRHRSSVELEVVPIIMDIPIKAYDAGSSQHPICALALDPAGDDEDSSSSSNSASKNGCFSGAVTSAVHEMERILEDSTRSMKNMATDTRDQQREWWRTRVELDDSLAALLQHVGGKWLGPWKCLFIGPPVSSSSSENSTIDSASSSTGDTPAEILRERVSSAVEQLLLGATAEGQELEKNREEENVFHSSDSIKVLNELAMAIAHCIPAMSASEKHQAATTLCTAFLEVNKGSFFDLKAYEKEKHFEEFKMEMVSRAVKLLNSAASSTSFSAPNVVPSMLPATVKKKKTVAPPTTRKVTFFQDDEVSSPPPCSPEPRTQLRQAPSFNNIDHIDNGGIDTGGGSNLCARFEALAVIGGGDVCGTGAAAATPLPARTPGAATIRAKKHRSRLALMQGAVTPAAKSVRKPLRPTTTTAAAGGGGGGGGYSEDDSSVPATISKNIAATASRMPRPLATPAAAYTMPARARNFSSFSSSSWEGPLNAAPVVAIFSPELQSLPWESVPGLVSQQIYRLHALPCAAAAAAAAASSTTIPGEPLATAAAAPCVDLSSAYYTINPSGDLSTTQETFETWFKGLRGWSGRAGSPPSSSELAHALQSKELFVYCGHGGGEQYIPTAKLRGLPRCAAALLMGCSSGRLRGGGGGGGGGGGEKQHLKQYPYHYYEPTGVVLAYLLAGCPAAVANLWDVTDRDIDKFTQAVLVKWLSSNKNSKESGDGGGVAAAVARARGACKLPFLIGAAPVCYGVPTTVVAQ